MDVNALLTFLIPNSRQWITDQRNKHHPHTSALPKDIIGSLGRYFREATVARARIRVVTEIENPPFYADLMKMGMNALIDFRQMAGITFDDTILINKPYSGLPPSKSLIFHELVHVAQYGLLGIDEFARQYVLGWAENGFSYASIPLEIEARELQVRFDGASHCDFSVEEFIEKQQGISH